MMYCQGDGNNILSKQRNVNIIYCVLSFDAFKIAMLSANRCLIEKTA